MRWHDLLRIAKQFKNRVQVLAGRDFNSESGSGQEKSPVSIKLSRHRHSIYQIQKLGDKVWIEMDTGLTLDIFYSILF